jgi:NAD(P)-dependent dehydrogenase (short-subunit alcohol dehydrogenase family)
MTIIFHFMLLHGVSRCSYKMSNTTEAMDHVNGADGDFVGAVAVVTGATRGLGFAIASALAALGNRIVVAGLQVEESERAAATLAGRYGVETFGVACDVIQIESVAAAWRTISEKFGRIDIWVNNAGLALTCSTIHTLSSEDFRAMVEVNLLGTMHGSKIAAAGMLGRRGAIYNIYGAGSDGVPIPGMIGYGTTKRAVQFFTEALAEEMAGTEVLVGGLSPGLVITEGFLREHSRVTPDALAEREAVVNIIGDDPETVAAWAADIIHSNRESGREFRWLTPEKISRRKSEGNRDILSKYLGNA